MLTITDEESTSLRNFSEFVIFSVTIESVWPEPYVLIWLIASSRLCTTFIEIIGPKYSVFQSSSVANFEPVTILTTFLSPNILIPFFLSCVPIFFRGYFYVGRELIKFLKFTRESLWVFELIVSFKAILSFA